jgi:peptidoglycan/xylan/chitin deacetylase (PgdA/CDA1 family)
MNLVSPLLKRIVYPGLAQMGYLRRCSRRGQLSVVTYHGVRPTGYRELDRDLDGSLVSSTVLRSQIRLLKSRYNVVSPEHFREWIHNNAELPERAVLLTCDDGLKNTLTEMAPILREEGVSCLFFITGASAGDVPRMLWYEELYLILLQAPPGLLEMEALNVRGSLQTRGDRRKLWIQLVKSLSRSDHEQRSALIEEVRKRCEAKEDWKRGYWDDGAARDRFWLLNASEVKQLLAGGMAIGAHTLSHPLLPEMSRELAWAEISESRRLLENALGTQVWALAYPFGDPASVTEREIDMAKAAGLECAFVNHGGGFGAELPPFALPRVHITGEMGVGEFEAHVSGFYRSLRKRWER